MKIEGRLARCLIALTFPIFKLWIWTLRFKLEDLGNIAGIPLEQRLIGSLWHNRLLLSAHAIRRFFPARPGAALISASRDGEIIANVVERYGFLPVRGSSSRQGTSALIQLADFMDSRGDVLITPDGPRGPAYKLQEGIVFLAQRTGVPVVPINFEYTACWRLNNWDRFILPKPFAKVRVVLGQPVHVRSTSTDEEFEAERLRLQHAMMSLVEMK